MILTLTLTRVQMWTMVILGREQMSGGQIFGVQMSGYDNNNNNNDNDNTASNSSSSFVRDYLSTAAPIRSRDRHTSVTTSCLVTLIFNYRLDNAVRFFHAPRTKLSIFGMYRRREIRRFCSLVGLLTTERYLVATDDIRALLF